MTIGKNHEKRNGNPMCNPRIAKVTVNISVGKSGEPLEKATTILEKLTNQRPCKRRARKTIRDFGIRKGEPIACLVTLRKERATDFLKKALHAIDNKLPKTSFDRNGNVSFGIKEHIEIAGTKYLPELGIYGMDVSVALDKPGYRVRHRRHTPSKIGRTHKLTGEEAMQFFTETFEVEIV